MQTFISIASTSGILSFASAMKADPLTTMVDSFFLQDHPRSLEYNFQPEDLDSTQWGDIPCEFVTPGPEYAWYNFVDMDTSAISYYSSLQSTYPVAYWNFCQ